MLGPALMEKETVIDKMMEGSLVYAIVSTEGRSDYGDLFAVYRQSAEDAFGKEVWLREYTNDFAAVKPWKIDMGDMDGDGIREILIAVKKTTRLDKTEKNRMFIFNYDGERLVKKWTGSQTGGIWRDFFVADMLKIPGDGYTALKLGDSSINYWFDFGFLRLAESDDFTDILDISVLGENRLRMTYDKEASRIISLKVMNGRIVEDLAIEDHQQRINKEGSKAVRED